MKENSHLERSTEPFDHKAELKNFQSNLSHDISNDLDVQVGFIERIRNIFQLAGPVVFSFFLGMTGNLINLFFAGHVGGSSESSVVFAGISLANMYINVTCLSILIGMTSAVETLASQYNGAGNYNEVGIVLQRSIVILSILSVPMIFALLNSGEFFRLVGVEEQVCQVVQKFVQIRALTLPIDILSRSYDKYLSSMGVVQPSMYASLTLNACLLILDCLFVFHFHFPYSSLAWSWVISTYLSGVIYLVTSLPYEEVKRTLRFRLGPETLRLSEIWTFFQLGLPGTVMLCSEWWAYEILTVMASALGTAEIAAQTIILQVLSLAFMMPLGIGVAASSIVGNAIGAKKLGLAIQLSKECLLIIMGVEVLMCGSIWLSGPFLAQAMTPDKDIQHLVTSAVPFLSLFAFGDGMQGVASGILRGAGRQSVGAVTNLMAFYLIGLPLAYVVCFRLKFGVDGLMMGMSGGMLFQVCVLLFLILGQEKQTFSYSVSPTGSTASLAEGGVTSRHGLMGHDPLSALDDEEQEFEENLARGQRSRMIELVKTSGLLSTDEHSTGGTASLSSSLSSVEFNPIGHFRIEQDDEDEIYNV